MDPPKDFRRGLYPSTVALFSVTTDGKEIEVEFDILGVGKAKKHYPKKFTSETDEKRELEEIAGKPLRLATKEDFLGKPVVMFLALKRGSGGRLLPAVGPVMALETFKEMVREIK